MDNNIKLDQLTGLRYFAALLVFFSHLNWGGSSEHIRRIFDSGYVGVSFFFLLSGFVLSYSYGEKTKDHSLSFIKYILLRLARLTPLHFLTALPFILLALYKDDFSFIKMVLNVFYLQSWVPNSTYYFSFNAPSWSLSNELFFYICFFPLSFLGARWLLSVCIALLLLVIFAAFYVDICCSEQRFFGGNTFAHWLFYVFPGFRLLEFIVGMLLFRLWKGRFRLSQSMVVPSYVMLFAAMYFAREVPESFRMSLFFLPFVVIFFYAHLTEGGIIVRFFSTNAMVLLGNSSFAFYLIHQPLIGICKRFAGSYGLSAFSFFFFSCVVITLLSIVTHIIFERRSEVCLKDLIRRKVP